MKTKEEIELDKFHNLLLISGIENRAFFTSNEVHTIWKAVKEYAKLYHQEKNKEECHCGGYPDCICNITTPEFKTLDQQRDDYYNRDKLFERKQVKDK